MNKLKPWQTGLIIFGGVMAGTIIFREVERHYRDQELEDVKKKMVEGVTESLDAAEAKIKTAMPDWMTGEQTLGEAAAETVASGWKDLKSSVGDAIDDIQESVEDELSFWFNKIR